MLAKVKISDKIYEDGKIIIPSLPDISISEAILAGTHRISVAASATNTSIPIANKGTIEGLFIWTDDTTTYLSVKINSSNAFNASDIEFTGAVTTLTVSNSDTVDAHSLNILVVVS